MGMGNDVFVGRCAGPVLSDPCARVAGCPDDRDPRRACLPVATRRGETRNTPYDLGFRRDTGELLATGVASL